MSINLQRINQITMSELAIGAPVFTADGKRLGRVAGLRERHFTVDASFSRDYWLNAKYVTAASHLAVRRSFHSSDAGAYKLHVSELEDQIDTEEVGHTTVLLSDEEQRAQREQMARALAEQRRALGRASLPPNAAGTRGEPVEAELTRIEKTGEDALDVQFEESPAEGDDAETRADSTVAPPDTGSPLSR